MTLREGQIEFSNATDFLNELGDRTVAEIVQEDEDLEYRLDFPLTGELEGTAQHGASPGGWPFYPSKSKKS